MNLFFRLLWMILFVKKQKLNHWSDFVSTKVRVGFSDLDLNGHLTNSRYLAFMDLGRLELIRTLDLIKPMLKKGWMPVLSTVNCSFIKEIPRGSLVDLRTSIVGFNKKYWFIRQQFYVNDKLYAQALCRGLFTSKKGNVCPFEVINHYRSTNPVDEVSETIPQYIGPWEEFLKEFKASANKG